MMRRDRWLVVLLAVAACRGAGISTTPRSPFFAADSLRDERRFAKAHPEYRRLRDSFALARDTAGWWRAQLWWGHTLTRLNRTDSARSALEEALALAGADSVRQGWTLLMRCGLWSRLSRTAEALQDCAQALSLADRLRAGDLQARIHFQLGTLYSRRGLYRRSVVESEQALALERQFGRSPHQLAGALNSMGVEYAAVGRLTEAAAAYEEGLAITRRVSDTSTAGYLISNLAALRSYTGRLDDAVSLMQQSLAAAQALGDTSSMVYALNSLTEYLLKAGNVPAARAQVEQSLAINASSPAIYQVIAWTDLALVAMAEGRPDSATAALSRAMPLAVSGGFAFERFRILSAQVRLAVGRRDRVTARRALGVAQTVADSLGSPDAELDVLSLAGSVAELERRPDAPQPFLDGIALLESWRGRLAMGDLRLGITEPKWSVYEGAIRTLFARGDTATALEVAERARARMLLEAMAERETSAGAEAALKARLRQRSEEVGAGADSAERRQVEAELAALRDSLTALERSAGPLRHPAPLGLAEVRSALLGNTGTALFEVFWGDSTVYAWWVTGTRLEGRRLGRSDSLEASIAFLRRTIETPGAMAWRAAAARAYSTLLAPFEAAGSATSLLAVMDGALARLPLEVLLPSPDSLPLGATRDITYGPSASALAALARSRAPHRWERALLAVGNPAGADRVPVESAASARLSERAPLTLPFAEAEARALHALYRAEGADILTGRKVTLNQWLALEPARYRYLHFATHTRVSDRDPSQSRLILADSALDPGMIRALSLSAELVTLSACETALGRQVRGEGVVGLAHAFLSAGARSTLVSLWPVVDRPTSRFMTELYQELHDGRAPPAALRAVRRRWIEAGGSTDHPSYWAPFVLLGDPAPPTM